MKDMDRKRATIEVHLQPGAKSNVLVGFREGVLYARVTVQPQRGQANRALQTLLSGSLGVPKSDIEIVRGHTSRRKVIDIKGLSREEVMAKVANLEGSQT